MRKVGFVLKKVQHHDYSYTILCKQLGKVTATVYDKKFRDKMVIGSLITGEISTTRCSSHAIRNIHLDSIPTVINYADISWFHLLLELCYYELPDNLTADEVVMHLYYTNRLLPFFSEKSDQQLSFKIAATVKLMTLLGHYPPDLLQCYGLFFDDLTRGCVDLLKKQKVSLLSDGKLQDNFIGSYEVSAWVKSCIQDSPHHFLFNTIHFLEW